jgi:surface carbohydrate biosynthesis protein
MNDKPTAESVVIMVDNKRRDLDIAALIALHIEQRGVPCHLVPLEAYQAVLAAYRPGIIVFNHMSASHVTRYSQRLRDLGVKTAVLLNEGIAYDADARAYTASRFHSDNHVDHFFSWNDAHAATVRGVLGEATQIHVVGVPRFDFYFEPWKRIFASDAKRFPTNERRNILFCTNFVSARMKVWPREEIDRFWGLWAANIPLYQDYMGAIDAQANAREQVTAFVAALARTDTYNLILRPHPNEERSFYEDWLGGLSAQDRQRIIYDTDTNISQLILETDLTVSCETCTTVLESWLCGKPTISIAFDKHPLWHRPIQVDLNVECDEPASLPALAEKLLTQGTPADLLKLRQAHLGEWCGVPDGTSARRIANILAEAVIDKEPARWNELEFADFRRGLRLKATDAVNIAYHYAPSITLKRMAGNTQRGKVVAYDKSIKPSDARNAIEKMRGFAATS